jgi:hypothetical protein
MIFKGLVIHKSLDFLLSRLKCIKGPVEFHLARRFVLGVVEVFEVGMRQALLGVESFVRIEHEHLVEEVERERVGFWVESCPWDFLPPRERANVTLGARVLYKINVIRTRHTKYRDNSLNLVKVVFAREQRRSTKQLREDTTDAPNVDSLRVVTCVENHLWSAVPSCDDVLG